SFGEPEAIELVEAMESLAERSSVTIAGGDVIAAPALTVSVTVVGWAGGERDLAYREGAEPRQLVGVPGTLGGAAAGLLLLRGGGDDDELPFTAAPDRRETVEWTARAAGATVTWVGSVAAGAGVRLIGPDGRPVELSGYEHP